MLRKFIQGGNFLLLGIWAGLIFHSVQIFQQEKERKNLTSALLSIKSPSTNFSDKKGRYEFRYYADNIIRRNLFNVSLNDDFKGKTKPFFPFEKKKWQDLPSDLRVVLKGTVTMESSRGWAIIENLLSHKQKLYKVGDYIAGRKIIAIGEKKIVLENKGKKEILLISHQIQLNKLFLNDENNKKEVGRSVISSTEETTLPSMERVELGKIIVNKKVKEDILSGANWFLVINNISPCFIGGKFAGYRIKNVNEESPLYRLGLKEGDIIKKVNGVTVDRLDKLIQACLSFKNTGEIEIVIEREGEINVLKYNIAGEN